MRIVRTLEEMKATSLPRPLGCVPTMGAFHEGHLELMRRARADCASVVVTLFVNPTQFGPTEDFARYPRREDEDARLAEGVGVDLLFVPFAHEMFPRRTTSVHVGEVGDRWEGPLRPGHFDGVATVVLKLLHLVRPDIAYFGLKDLQQCAVVRRMVEDLNIPVELRFLETVRDSDGLALSSRNAYLEPPARAIAPRFYLRLLGAARAIGKGEEVSEVLDSARRSLEEDGFEVEYLALVDPLSMNPIDHPLQTARIVSAVRLQSVRLLDNVEIELEEKQGVS